MADYLSSINSMAFAAVERLALICLPDVAKRHDSILLDWYRGKVCRQVGLCACLWATSCLAIRVSGK
jgi:hypothetical protein